MQSTWWRVGLLSVSSLVAVGCTKLNPNSCESGVCSDPALPYCDVTGAVGGTPKACIAVACTPNALQTCDGDSAITCNATGDNYDTTRCDLGCEPGIGCRVCQPGETVCANGMVQTCDASGAVTSSQTCPLGCFENLPRCRDIDPSNGLGQYMDMAAAGPDLVLTDADGSFLPNQLPMSVQTITVAAQPGGGAPMMVIPLHTLTVSGTIQAYPGDPSSPAVVFLVAGPVEINGSIRFSSYTSDGITFTPALGALRAGPCVGSVGRDSSGFYLTGAGGGGGATMGGAGGAQFFPASAGGSAFAHPDLQPLRGGCAGGSTNESGGGAIQISSATSIHLGPNAVIEMNGASPIGVPSDGTPDSQAIPAGGGSGGGILLEAPRVTLDSGSMLVANGGAGVSGDGHSGTSATGRTPARGGVCLISSSICTNGGDGGSVDAPAKTAGSIAYTNQQELHTGAGGGSVGFVRINTRDGTFSQASDTYLSPAPSAGMIKTR